MGEGWHNNHHHYCASTRQGFYWWEIDITYYILKVLSWMGIVWKLQPVPAKVLEEGPGQAPAARAGSGFGTDDFAGPERRPEARRRKVIPDQWRQ